MSACPEGSCSPTVDNLHDLTREFFRLHLLASVAAPAWSADPWRFVGSIPQQELRGCYALLSEERVLYVGVGAGQNAGRYEGAGLGQRLHRYWKVDAEAPRTETGERRYRAAERFEHVTSIATLGFGEEAAPFWYLAYALEPYLIAQLVPAMNSVWARR